MWSITTLAARLSHLRRFGLDVEDPPPCARPNSGNVSCVSTAAAAAAVLPVCARAAVHFWTVLVKRCQSRVFRLEVRESIGKGTGKGKFRVYL